MYAAKKYLLTGLVAECGTVLEKELSVDTVCTLLEQSMSLGENALKQKSLNFISKNIHRVFNTEEFVHLSHDALEEIVSLDCLVGSSERQLYERCVKWARQQLRETGNKSPSDAEIREKLGNILYKIRFPTMTQKDFAELTAQSAVLTAEEQRDVYVYMALGMELETLHLQFATQIRRVTEKVISRFNRIRGEWNCSGPTDAISFQTTVDIVLTDVGLYGGIEASGHDVTLQVLKGSETLSKTVTKMSSEGGQKPVKIKLENPVHVHANTMYTIAAVINGPKTWSGKNGKSACDFPESGSIAFYMSAMSRNSTDVSHGQIPQLFYHVLHSNDSLSTFLES